MILDGELWVYKGLHKPVRSWSSKASDERHRGELRPTPHKESCLRNVGSRVFNRVNCLYGAYELVKIVSVFLYTCLTPVSSDKLTM